MISSRCSYETRAAVGGYQLSEGILLADETTILAFFLWKLGAGFTFHSTGYLTEHRCANPTCIDYDAKEVQREHFGP